MYLINFDFVIDLVAQKCFLFLLSKSGSVVASRRSVERQKSPDFFTHSYDVFSPRLLSSRSFSNSMNGALQPVCMLALSTAHT